MLTWRQPIRIHPSLYLAAMLAAGHGAACAVVLLLLPLWAGLALSALLLASLLYYSLRDAWLRLPGSCVALAPDEDGVVVLKRDGTQVRSRIMPGSIATPVLTILLALPEGARLARSVVILPDSLEAESFRNLRVWLKWGGHASGKDRSFPEGR